MSDTQYEIRTVAGSQVSLKDLCTCIEVVKVADAVDPDSANLEIPRAQVLAIASSGKSIVGIGAIKRNRPEYASHIAERAGVSLDSNASELGYFAVVAKHQGNGLSARILQELLSRHRGALFATTASVRMKKTLTRAGFSQKGGEWKGRNDQLLSLWIKEKINS